MVLLRCCDMCSQWAFDFFDLVWFGEERSLVPEQKAETYVLL